MNKEGILKEVKNSNLTEECKTEVIQITERYNENRAEEILPLLFELIEIAPVPIRLFCGHLQATRIMDIGNAIKLLRRREDISQKELSNLHGISTNTSCNIEPGDTFPSKSTIAKICNALKIPESYLLLFSILEEDIPENKRVLYKTLCESIKEDLIQSL